MLHFSVEDGYTLNGTSVVDGIHCNKFVSKEVKVPAINGSFHVEYHWTGRDAHGSRYFMKRFQSKIVAAKASTHAA